MIGSEILCTAIGFISGVVLTALAQVRVFNNLNNKIKKLESQLKLKRILIPITQQLASDLFKSIFGANEKGKVIKNKKFKPK